MSLESNISELQPWMQAYVDRLSPQSRKQLLRQVGTSLKKENRKRMTDQKNPDGQAWEPRKPQKQHDKKQNNKKLFLRLRQAKRLRHRVMSDRLQVGFVGRTARLARIHHYGLRQQLKYGEAKYPARELIGISASDKKLVADLLINHIGGD